MRLAYLMSEFPWLTVTFIYREVFEIQRRGIKLKLYSLRKPPSTSISEEALPLQRTTYYLLPVRISSLMKSHFNLLLRHTGKYFRTLFGMIIPAHRSLRHRYRSLMHFGEGVLLAEQMRVDGISHIHAHFASQPTSVARVVHLLTGIPYSFTAHASDIWHNQLLLSQKVSEAVFVVCCTEFGRRYLLQETGSREFDKIHVVYHGIDTTRFAPPKEPGQRTRNLILSVGALGKTKGFSDLIAACAILRDKGFQFECCIVGEGPERSELEDQVQRLGLEQQVKMPGSVKQESIIDYYYSAWVFVLPCVVAPDGRGDNLPNVLMEAMATGLPVITTNTRGQSELIEDGVHGLFVPQGSPRELAAMIELICDNESMRARITERGRKRIEDRFDNRMTTLDLVRLLEDKVFCRLNAEDVRTDLDQ